MEFTYKGKTYLFAEYVEPHTNGLCTAILTDSENNRCEIVWFDGELQEITELIKE